ncbi:AraC-like DNA-binding protein [Parvibaculum indicum]|uniref:helix-turn-helix domain-containing protein n=1 Tax=Parvibaculum indicum TaxID=562969 RepID=UPI001421FA9B|nr:AraC-like DNA-binding protein [Parvibaculum indicum]
MCERLDFSEGFALCRVQARTNRPTLFEAPVKDGDYLHIQVLLEGCCAFRNHKRDTRLAPFRSVLLDSDRNTAGWLSDSGCEFHAVSIDISRERLSRWVDRDTEKLLKPLLRDGQHEVTAMNSPDFDIWRRLSGEVLRSGRDNTMRRLAIESHAMQIVHSSMASLFGGEDGGLPGLTPRDRDAAHDMRDRLSADFLTPPDLSSLAAEYRMSPRRLERAFRESFGVSSFQYLLNVRLDYAYQALLGGELHYKEIAWRLGYRHATSFSHAFRKKFGIAPSELVRRSMRAKHPAG